MANNAMVAGATAQRVAANVRALRKAAGLDLSQLSELLTGLGQPISLSGLSKLETGQRRVDVDDLVALALALDVSPNRLLLTEDASNVDVIELTPAVSASEMVAWRWACGVRRIRPTWQFDLRRRDKTFERVNRPHDPPDDMTTDELLEREKRGDLATLNNGYIEARKAGMTTQSIIGYLRMRDTFDHLGAWAAKHAEEPDDGQR